MAEDEDQEAAAALAKLAGQDPAAAEDAPAALEWIAGEQGRAFITQERIQGRRAGPGTAGVEGPLTMVMVPAHVFGSSGGAILDNRPMDTIERGCASVL